MAKVLIGDIAGPTGPTGPTGPAGTSVVAWVNAVTAFSADPTGGSDSTSEIQKALLSFGTADGWSQGAGGVAYLPAGSYKISNTLIIPPGVVLRGDGPMSSILTMSTTVAADLIQFEIYDSAAQATILAATDSSAGLTQSELVNAFFAGVEDLALHGNAFYTTTAAYNHGINCTTNPLTSAAGSDPGFDPTNHISNVFIEACTGDGIFMSGRSGTTISDVNALYNNGNGITTTFDTLIANCNFGFNGITGVYNNHGTTCGSSIKAYNNGMAPVWVSGTAYTAGKTVYYSGQLYFCILSIGSSTTIPSTDTTHFTHLTAASSPASYGYDFAWDSNASSQSWAGIESQEPSVGSFWFNSCKAISVHGAASAPNFNNVSGAGQNGSNPNSVAAVYVDAAVGCNISVSANSMGSLAYMLSIPAATSCNILLATDGTEEGVLAPSSVLTGNLVVANGSVKSVLTAAQAVTSGVAVLTYSSSLAVNAALGNHFRVTLTGNVTIGAPSNPTDGQKITFELIQDSTGSRTGSWNSAFDFGSSTTPTLTTTANKRDLVGFVYSSSASKWLYSGISQGL